MTDMGGVYKIAEAISGASANAPERFELDKRVWDEKLALDRERLYLDRRAIALKDAVETVRLTLTKDERPDHERVLEAARAYYEFLAGGNGPQDTT